MRSLRGLGLCLAAVALTACAPTIETEAAGGASASASGGPGHHPGGDGAAGGATSSPEDPGKDAACHAESAWDCVNCCSTTYLPPSYDNHAIAAAAVQCACTSPGLCHALCVDDYCGFGGFDPESACATCVIRNMEAGGACVVNAACHDASCEAYVGCRTHCPPP